MGRKLSTRTCTLCAKPHYAKDFCRNHYTRWRSYGDPLEVRSASPGQGKPLMTTQGYVLLPNNFDHPNSQKDGKILEHIYVMSQSLGRPLVAGENVHHKNGVKTDNRIENLELWNTKQPKGQRPEDKITYAIEILELYKPGFLSDIYWNTKTIST